MPNHSNRLLLEPESIRRPLPSHDSESIYETPYSTYVNENSGGPTKALRNVNNDQSTHRKWGNCIWVIIGLLIVIVIGGTVTGLLMHFRNTTEAEVETTVATTTVPDTIAPTARNAFLFP